MAMLSRDVYDARLAAMRALVETRLLDGLALLTPAEAIMAPDLELIQVRRLGSASSGLA